MSVLNGNCEASEFKEGSTNFAQIVKQAQNESEHKYETVL